MMASVYCYPTKFHFYILHWLFYILRFKTPNVKLPMQNVKPRAITLCEDYFYILHVASFLFSAEGSYRTHVNKEDKWREIEVAPLLQWSTARRIDLSPTSVVFWFGTHFWSNFDQMISVKVNHLQTGLSRSSYGIRQLWILRFCASRVLLFW